MTNRRAAATGGIARLARDRGGNTLAMMAAAMIPITAIAGSAIDTARMYVVKVRLQQACDAGVLAGRKFMDSSGSPTLDANADTRAREFFRNNFRNSWMQTSAVQFTPVKTADQQVSANAQATVPMTIMRMFTAPDVTLRVRCEARFDVADADVMFVLDTTGSMACTATDTTSACAQNNAETYQREDGTQGYAVREVNDSKIGALRTAVLNFYDTMVANADPTTHIRYGFVPYSSSTNVGRLIPANMLYTGPYSYASRRPSGESNDGGAFNYTVPGATSANCSTYNGRYPNAAATDRTGWTTTGTAYRLSGAAWNNGACKATRQNLKITSWYYGAISFDIAGYAAGQDVVDPSKVTGVMSRRWQGCIEERQTTATATFDLNALPADLNPDLIPNSTETMWKPAWPDVVYLRGQVNEFSSNNTYDNVGVDTDMLEGGYWACGKAARRLGTMTRAQVADYLSAANGFRPHGGTYHDVGMIWGTRLIAPAGPFQADTAAWPGRNAPNRHIIFMTDGDMAPNTRVYGLYGVEQSDRRVTGNDLGQQLNRHNARFVAECRAARARNIEVWVIAFGSQLNQQLRDCATQDGNHVFFAANNTALQTAFTRIAQQIAMLRVSQ